jgi:hypothetical protein
MNLRVVRVIFNISFLVVDDLPTRANRHCRKKCEDQNRDQELEDDDQLPIPFTQLLNVLGASVVDPEADERSNRVEHLPEGHDLAADLWRRR